MNVILDKILIEKVSDEFKTDTGIILLSDNIKGSFPKAKVLDYGSKVIGISVGDIVVYDGRAEIEVEDEGQTHTIITFGSVHAVE